MQQSIHCSVFLTCILKLPYITLSRVITATMLFLQFVLYGTLELKLKEKTAGSACLQTIFPFLMTMVK